jgi:hypothetical protein
MLEDELREEIAKLCSEFGYICHHTRDSRKEKKSSGWPDCVIIGHAGIIFAELKSDTERLSAEQRKVGSKIQAAGGRWVVWRPRHLREGLIRARLAELAGNWSKMPRQAH